MTGWFSRKLLLPLNAALWDRRALQLAATRLTAPQSDSEIWANQSLRLQQLLKLANEKIPFWAERLRGLGPLLAAGNPRVALLGIPVLTRSDLRANFERAYYAPHGSSLQKRLFAGGSDEPDWFLCGPERDLWDRALRLQADAEWGFHGSDPEIRLEVGTRNSAGAPASSIFKCFHDWLRNRQAFDPRPFDSQPLEPLVRRLERQTGSILSASPSWIQRLIAALARRSPRPRLRPLRAVLCRGETLHAIQRRRFEEYFGVPVYEVYGLREIGMVARDDSERIMRCNVWQVMVEILRSGQPAPPGEFGEVVVTSLTAELMPFIRYATGDAARQPISGDMRMDGDRLPRFPRIEGRLSELLLSTRGDLLPSRPLVERLMEQLGLLLFRLQQFSQSMVEVQLPDEGRSSRPAIESIIRSYLGRGVEVQFKTVDRFRMTQEGKHRFVSSLPAAALLSHEVDPEDELSDTGMRTALGTTEIRSP